MPNRAAERGRQMGLEIGLSNSAFKFGFMSGYHGPSRKGTEQMRSPALPFAVALAAVLAGPATAQLPFGTPPLPESGVLRQCSKDYVASLEAQAKAIAKMRTAGPELVGEICSMIEQGSALIGGELPDGMRRQLKDLFGFDVDLRFIKTQCRIGQGNLDRELTTQLGFLKSEIGRCSDSI